MNVDMTMANDLLSKALTRKMNFPGLTFKYDEKREKNDLNSLKSTVTVSAFKGEELLYQASGEFNCDDINGEEENLLEMQESVIKKVIEAVRPKN
jgi:hypothetical protein